MTITRPTAAGPNAARPTVIRAAPPTSTPAHTRSTTPPSTEASVPWSAADARPARIPGLDGLRALAVAAVLAFHLFPGSLPGGFLGVDVFFVVSGFLITTLLLREIAATGRVHLGAFWARRARRLLPALLLVVLVGVTAARAVGGDLVVDLDRQVAGALTFSTNWREIAAGSSYFTHTAPLMFAPFWSLAVEEQFYLLWPIALVVLLAVVRTPRPRVAVPLLLAAASALAMAVLVVPGQDPTRVYYGTDTHAFGLMIGAALALAVHGTRGPVASRGRRTALGVAGLALLAGLAVLMADGATLTYRGGLLLASLASAAVIASLPGPRTPLVAVFEARPLVWLGRRSYGVYLWHWPVYLVVVALLPAAAPGTAAARLAGWLALALTLALAAASYRWVEEPVRRHGFRESARRVWSALAVPWREAKAPRVLAGAVVVLLATTVVTVATAPSESATERAIRAGEAALAEAEAAAAAELAAADFSVPAGEEITAFGDSIMVTSLGGLTSRFPGIDVQARSIRQWPEGAQVVRDALAAGTVRRAVILGLGTNAGVTDPDLVRAVIEDLGPYRMIALVNVYQYSHWVPETNAALAAIAAEYPNVVLVDWHGAISQRPDLLQSDQIHPGVEGGHFYADVVARAFEDLAARIAAQGSSEDADDGAPADA